MREDSANRTNRAAADARDDKDRLPSPASTASAVPQPASQTADVELAFDDTDQIEAQGRCDGWDVRLYQLARGRMSGHYWGLALPGLYVSRAVYGRPLHVTGAAPGGSAPLLVPFRTDSAPIYRGRHIDGAQILHLQAGEVFDLFTGGGLDFVTIQSEPGTLRRAGRTADDRDAKQQASDHAVIRPGSGALAGLKRTLRDIFYSAPPHRDSLGKPAARQALASDLAEQIVSALDGTEPGRGANAAIGQRNWPCYARRARDFMEANLNQPLHVEELCREIGISRRSLFYAFQDYFGVTPIQYHKFRRLRAARDHLKATDASQTSVTDAATAWGFWHLGRFASDYKRLFGETPSETLTRRPLLTARLL